jgi:ABC-2 type transport system permease protein
MGGLFYDALSTVHSRGSVLGRWKWRAARRTKNAEVSLTTGPLHKVFAWMRWLRPDVRALMVKDTRMFWRDTTQWAQSLMLFGLLGVYIFNLRHFSQQLVNPFWVHLVSYLNLGACSLNLATLTTRFVYPQFSLEGKRIWIVGMAPLGMVQIVKTKFWLATVTSLVVTIGLITLSCQMLNMSWLRTLHFAGAVTVMTLTLTGLAVGLGALYPNFREENPSKIVSGFGGTFCLVLSFLYILTSIIVLAFSSPWTAHRQELRAVFCIAAFLAFSAVLGYVPMRLGLRRVRTVEL